MAELRPPDQGSSGSGTGDPRPQVRKPAAASPASSTTDLWLSRWSDRLQGQVLPENEARLVLDALLEDVGSGRLEQLDQAGRAWGRAHRSVSEMVGRLSSLREELASAGFGDQLRWHRDLDRVTASATEDVLHRLERASRTDALTGVGNRRAFDETLSAALSAATRQGHEVTVVAVDLDGLKRINDTDGHAAGDAALLALVRAFYVALRDEDTIFRVGGDEFMILLPFTSVNAAELLMERVERGGAPSFTWGAAGYPDDGPDALGLVEAADRNLYRRREDRRAPVAAAIAASLARPPARAPGEGHRPRWQWAWVPAMAVLIVSLVATLVSSSPLSQFAAKGKGHPPVTTPGRSGVPSGRTPAPPTSSVSGRPPGGGAALTTGYVTIPGPAIGSPGSSTTSPGTSPGTSPTGPSSPPPASGGVLGTLESLLSVLPGVGGNNGLVADVEQLLTGTPETVTGVASSTPVSADAANAANGASSANPTTSSSSAVGLVTNLLAGALG